MTRLSQILKRIAQCIFARYVVEASFDGKTAKHYARNYAEALAWARCYPADDKVEVYELVSGMQAVAPFAARAIV